MYDDCVRFISQPASPAGGAASASTANNDVCARAHHAVRTSRSEDHLQVGGALILGFVLMKLLHMLNYIHMAQVNLPL